MKFLFVLCLVFVLHFQLQSQIKEYTIWEKEVESKKYISENQLIKTLDSLSLIGYYTLKIDSIKEFNISKNYYISRGKFYAKHLVSLDSLAMNVIKKPEIEIKNLDSILQVVNEFYQKKGYSFNTVQFKKKNLKYHISVELGNKRTINKFEIQGFTSIPKGLKSVLNSQFLQTLYTDDKLRSISNFIKTQPYLIETKPPQVLFTKDSTKIYLYLQKNKSSSFDGIVGFGNDKNSKFSVTGNVNLELGNIFNSFEKITLNWFSTPETSQNLTIGFEIPYLFKTKIGSKSQVNIYKQDSTFIRFKLYQNIYYRLSNFQKLGINGIYENSNFIDTINTDGFDYKKTGLGINYEYIKPLQKRIIGNENEFYIQTTYLSSLIKNISTEKQYFIQATALKTFAFKEKHYLQLKLDGLTLLSDSLVSNELSRIGGVYSLRGFNEQSIAASSYLKGTIEYKYAPSEEFYLNAFTDYAIIENKVLRTNQNFLGIGFGIGFMSKFGLFSLQYAMGKLPESNFNFNDSKIHIGVRSSF